MKTLPRAANLLTLSTLTLALVTAPGCASQPPVPSAPPAERVTEAQRSHVDVDIDSLLGQLTDLSTLSNFRHDRSRLFSSADPSGSNDDFQQFLSMKDGVGVLVDLDGPGAIARIWSANPDESGHLRIYIDHASAPVVDVPFKDYFTSSLSHYTAGGYSAYLPIPFEKHCRVEVVKPTHLYYQVNVLQFDPSTTVRSYALPYSAKTSAAIRQLTKTWIDQPVTPPDFKFTRSVALPIHRATEIFSSVTPGVINHFALKFSTALAALDPALLRHVVLRAYFDDHKLPDVEAPVADFFGNPWGNTSFSSLIAGMSAKGSYFLAPMPFAKSARFTIENELGEQLSVAVDVRVVPRAFVPDRDAYFHAQFGDEYTTVSQPHVWLRLKNQRGHFLGVVQAMVGDSMRFLEGDEQIRVDDEKWIRSSVGTTTIGPWNGTGTEDYFNSGWYFKDTQRGFATHGVVAFSSAGAIGAYRWHFLETPVFQSSIDAQMEHGDENTNPGTYYSSVAYWYSDRENPLALGKALKADRIRLLRLKN